MNLLPAAQMPTLQVGPEAETVAAQLRSGGKQSVDAVATGFESMFMSLILKEMRQTLEPGMLFGQDSSGSSRNDSMNRIAARTRTVRARSSATPPRG